LADDRDELAGFVQISFRRQGPIACARAAPFSGLRHNFVGGFAADYHEFGNDEHSTEPDPAAPTAHTTGRPYDFAASSA
jgi:hypothetical protein